MNNLIKFITKNSHYIHIHSISFTLQNLLNAKQNVTFLYRIHNNNFPYKKNLIFPRCNVAITSCYHHIVWQLGMFTLKFSFQRVFQQLLNTIMHEKNTICYCRSTPLIAVALQDKCKHFLGFKLAVVGDWQVKKIKSFDCRTISVYIFFFG